MRAIGLILFLIVPVCTVTFETGIAYALGFGGCICFAFLNPAVFDLRAVKPKAAASGQPSWRSPGLVGKGDTSR